MSACACARRLRAAQLVDKTLFGRNSTEVTMGDGNERKCAAKGGLSATPHAVVFRPATLSVAPVGAEAGAWTSCFEKDNVLVRGAKRVDCQKWEVSNDHSEHKN